MPERNWAEHDKRIRDNPTLEECRKTGHTHAKYGWSRIPWGGWNAEQVAHYNAGYDEGMTDE